MSNTLFSPSNINTKTDLYLLEFAKNIIEIAPELKNRYISFLIDLIDSKSKITHKFYTEAKSYLSHIFSDTFLTEDTIDSVIQKMKNSSSNPFGSILAIHLILRNPKKYIDKILFDASSPKNGSGLVNILVNKHDILNKLCTIGKSLCEKASINEFNGDDLADFYDNIFYSIYKLSVLRKTFEMEHLQQILDQLTVFKDDQNLLMLTTKILDTIIGL